MEDFINAAVAGLIGVLLAWAAFFVLNLAFAPYRTERERADREQAKAEQERVRAEAEKRRADDLAEILAPKIEVKFEYTDQGCIHQTHEAGHEDRGLLFISTIVKAKGDGPVLGCQGWLAEVRKWNRESEVWEQSSLNTRQALEWGGKGYTSIDLSRRGREALNVAVITLAQRKIIPRVAQHLNKDAHLFDDQSDIFRFDIVVTAKNSTEAAYSLKIAMGSDWNRPVVEVL